MHFSWYSFYNRRLIEDKEDKEEGKGPDEPEPEVDDSNQELEAETAKVNWTLQYPLPILGCCPQLPVPVHPDLHLLLHRPPPCPKKIWGNVLPFSCPHLSFCDRRL